MFIQLSILRAVKGTPCTVPLLASDVAAGFPSPADDYIETPLDLNQHLVRHSEATFFVRVRGQSMIGAGIQDGDLLIVDRAAVPGHGDIVIAAVGGEMTVKRLHSRGGVVKLVAENAGYPDIPIDAESGLMVWGVVRHAVHSFP